MGSVKIKTESLKFVNPWCNLLYYINAKFVKCSTP